MLAPQLRKITFDVTRSQDIGMTGAEDIEVFNSCFLAPLIG